MPSMPASKISSSGLMPFSMYRSPSFWRNWGEFMNTPPGIQLKEPAS